MGAKISALRSSMRSGASNNQNNNSRDLLRGVAGRMPGPGERSYKTPLYLATTQNQDARVAALLKEGAPVDELSGRHGLAALHLAANQGATELVVLLLKHGATRDIRALRGRGIEGTTPLLLACNNGHLATVQALVTRGADVNAMDVRHITPLSAASAQGHSEVVRFLLEHGADFCTSTIKGQTALYRACKHGHLAVAEMLVAQGADVDHATRKGATPSHVAARHGYFEIVRLLLEHGADIVDNHGGMHTLHVAAMQGHGNIVSLLLNAGAAVDQCTTDVGLTPLHLACSRRHIQIAALLLHRGADPYRVTSRKATPLSVACANVVVKGTGALANRVFRGVLAPVQINVGAAPHPAAVDAAPVRETDGGPAPAEQGAQAGAQPQQPAQQPAQQQQQEQQPQQPQQPQPAEADAQQAQVQQPQPQPSGTSSSGAGPSRSLTGSVKLPKHMQEHGSDAASLLADRDSVDERSLVGSLKEGVQQSPRTSTDSGADMGVDYTDVVSFQFEDFRPEELREGPLIRRGNSIGDVLCVLPVEMLDHVIRYLDVRSTLVLGSVCRAFYQITSRDWIWQEKTNALLFPYASLRMECAQSMRGALKWTFLLGHRRQWDELLPALIIAHMHRHAKLGLVSGVKPHENVLENSLQTVWRRAHMGSLLPPATANLFHLYMESIPNPAVGQETQAPRTECKDDVPHLFVSRLHVDEVP